MGNSSRCAVALGVASFCVLAVLGVGCGGESECALQCEILEDCGAVERADIDECVDTCESLLAGDCDDDQGCQRVASGGDPEECAEALLDVNREADENECTDDFVEDWCDTYYNDPACSPFVIGGISCSSGARSGRGASEGDPAPSYSF